MPYIKQEDRVSLYPSRRVNTPGELNYLISVVCREYIEDHDLSYKTINDLIGAIEGAKLELYRRVASPYEDLKIEENGDVYG